MVFKDRDYNVLIIILFIAIAMLVFWWNINDLPSGTFYFGLTTFAITTIVFLNLLINETSGSGVLKDFKFPISISTTTASVMLLGGTGLFFILNTVTNVFSKFSIYDFLIPFSAQETTTLIQQTAQQLSISANLGYQMINSVLVAGVQEEIVFGWLSIVVFYVIIKKFSIEALKIQVRHNTALIGSFIITGIIFASLHTLNSTYGVFSLSDPSTWTTYIIAVMFRLLMSGIIYYSGAFLMATIGFHMANNFTWFINNRGLEASLNALFSFPGILILVFYGVAIIVIINDIKGSKKAISLFWRDIGKTKS